MNVYIFGLGQSTKAHVKSLLGFPTISRILIFTNYPVRVAHEKVSCFSRECLDSVVKQFSPHLFLIASSTESHLIDFQLISDFDVPIVFEKPISSSIDDTRKVLSYDSILIPPYVFFQRRLSPEFQAILNLAKSNAFGSPNTTLCHLSKYKKNPNVGYLSHYGIHYIDLIFQLLDVRDFKLKSFLSESPEQEKVSSISGIFNSNIYFSILLDCRSLYSFGSKITIQYDKASIIISDDKVSISSDQTLIDSYNSLLQRNRAVFGQTSTNMADYKNYWSFFLRSYQSGNLPDKIPTATQCFEVEKFINYCYVTSSYSD